MGKSNLALLKFALIALFHDQGVVDFIDNGRSSVTMGGTIPTRYLTAFQPFFIGEDPEDPADEEDPEKEDDDLI